MHELDFTGRVVLVVGGTRGIGNAIARSFLSHGASVYVWGTRVSSHAYERGRDSDLRGLSYARVDVTILEDVAKASESFERIDTLVLSQAISLPDRQEFTPENFRHVLDVNLVSVLNCCTCLGERLKHFEGSAVLLNSIGAFRSNRVLPAYDASKAALESLTRNVALDWAPNARANGIAPGYTPTALTEATTSDPSKVAAYLKRVPLARAGTVDDVAGVALFLASPLASFITGQTLVVDGGRLLV